MLEPFLDDAAEASLKRRHRLKRDDVAAELSPAVTLGPH